MFQSLFRQAQDVVDRSVDHVAKLVVMAVPFLVAAGFGAAALAIWLTREYGALTANLILAGLFCVVGLILVAVFASKPSHATKSSSETEHVEAAQSPNEETVSPAFTSSEREMLMTLAKTVAPIAGPTIVRALLRNLSLVAVIGVIVYVISRPSPFQSPTATAAEFGSGSS